MNRLFVDGAGLFVDIGTEWNLKGKISDYLYRTQKVDIGTEWNLKDICLSRADHDRRVDIGTEWNLKHIVEIRRRIGNCG